MTNKNEELKTLDARITKLENFISQRLDQVIDGKIRLIESYFIKKIDELNNRIDSLDSRIDDIERRLSDLE